MATTGQGWYGFPGGTLDAVQTHPRAVQYDVEFDGMGVQVWGTDRGIASGTNLFDLQEMPLVGVTVTAGNDRRVFSETGNHGVIIREGEQNADEQWHYRVFWDGTVGAWSVLVVFGGAITDAVQGTQEMPHDDGAVRYATITMIGPDNGWVP